MGISAEQRKTPNESPEPTGAAFCVVTSPEKFADPWLRRCAVSGAIGSARR